MTTMENHEDSSYSMNTMKKPLGSIKHYFRNVIKELPELSTGYPQAVKNRGCTDCCRNPPGKSRLNQLITKKIRRSFLSIDQRRTKAALEESELIKGWGIFKGEGHHLSRGS